jgi:hypothetical protein
MDFSKAMMGKYNTHEEDPMEQMRSAIIRGDSSALSSFLAFHGVRPYASSLPFSMLFILNV